MDTAGYGRSGARERGLDISGYGPLLVSTCRAVARIPLWDVNGYYRELGFAFGDRPTMAQLRVAYLHHGGVDSPRLTSIMSYLWHNKRDYDRRAFGDVVFDQLFSEQINRAALTRARQEGTTQSDVLDEWGLSKQDQLPRPEAEIRAYSPTSPRHVPSARVTWPWSFYREYSVQINTALLARWQQLLLKEELPIPRFAVGYTGVGYPFDVQVVGGEWTFLLNEDVDATEKLAEEARQKVLLLNAEYAFSHSREHHEVQRW